MKRLAALMSVLALGGCAEKPFHTGTVFVDGFTVDTYGSGRPMAVKQDVVTRVTEELEIELNRSILEGSRLYTAPSCEKGTYRLVGTVFRIDPRPREAGAVPGTGFELTCRGSLFRCDDGTEVDDFSVTAARGDLDSAIASLADGIVAEVRKSTGP